MAGKYLPLAYQLGRASGTARQLNGFFFRTASTHQIVFDKKLRLKHLDISSLQTDAHVYDYIRDHVAKELCDRIDDLKLDEKLDVVLNIGSCSGLVAKNLNETKLNTLIQCDASTNSLLRCKKLDSMLKTKQFNTQYMLCDQETMPIRENSFDLVTSCLDLHWVNDLVKCFSQVQASLRDNSAFIGSMFGGDTLYELRSALQLAELERLSGFSSHIAPKTTGQDVARLLQASGFKLITVDISELTINYPSMFELMFDLQGMGESNASIIGSLHMHRDVLQAAAALYQTLYGNQEDLTQGIPATFQIVHFIGWKNPTQATPLKSAPKQT